MKRLKGVSISCLIAQVIPTVWVELGGIAAPHEWMEIHNSRAQVDDRSFRKKHAVNFDVMDSLARNIGDYGCVSFLTSNA